MRTLSKKELEQHVVKCLHKANRVKSLPVKLEKINGVMALLTECLPTPATGDSAPLIEQKRHDIKAIEQHLQLCRLHKLKFQMDVLLDGVHADLQRLQHAPEQFTPAMFEYLLQRVQALVSIDADYRDVQHVLRLIETEYPQYSQEKADAMAALQLAPYQAPDLSIDISCLLSDLERHEFLKTRYHAYQVEPLPASNPPALCRMHFSLRDIEDFGLFHEELRFKPAYTVAVNQRRIEEQAFSDWFQCYKRFLKARNPRYCYGASPFTFNLFGCHKLTVPDVAKHFEYCWFHQGKLDPESGFFFVSVNAIAKQIQQHLPHCGFCPALTQEKIRIGMLILPRAINPEYDQHWRYAHTHGERTGVLPIGNDLVIATLDTDFSHPDPATLLEVRSTPYIDRVFAYLGAPNPLVLNDPPYAGLSTCVQCGAPYKPHTMICSRCKNAFWKYALRNLEEIVSTLHPAAGGQTPPPAAPAPKIEMAAPPQKIIENAAATVSFAQLWDDPLVQKILGGETQTEEPASPQPARRKVDESRYHIPEEIVAQRPPLPKPTATPQELKDALAQIAQSRTTPGKRRTASVPSRNLRLHEKVVGLFLKPYRERKALETAFSHPRPRGVPETAATAEVSPPQRPIEHKRAEAPAVLRPALPPLTAEVKGAVSAAESFNQESLRNAIKNIKPRQKSELSKRGVVRVIYHATLDQDTCPLCDYLDGMVMDPDDPATDVFSPPLYPGCTCSREYVLKTEKPQHWPKVTFKFPPEELLMYLDNKLEQE